MKTLLPSIHSCEKSIFAHFAQNNFERSRRFSRGAYSPLHIKNFLEACNNPQYSYKTIHVAGTVGKGSTCVYLTRALIAMNFKTGTYLSPHFYSLRERFLKNEKPIAGSDLELLWKNISRKKHFSHLSYFDALTAMAFVWFAEIGIDYAVIETGLGGQKDSTNNLDPEFCVITTVGLDHQNILGSTIAKIAAEKAGIIQSHKPIYTLNQHKNVLGVLKKIANTRKAPLHIIRAKGNDFLTRNQNFVLHIIRIYFNPSLKVMRSILKNSRRPIWGRYTIIQRNPTIIFDSAHNEDGIRALLDKLQITPQKRYRFYMNTMRERDLSLFVSLIQKRLGNRVEIFLILSEDPLYHLADDVTGINPNNALRLTDLKKQLQLKNCVHVVTGSMGLYGILKKIRF